ncbi:PepSY-associated TM helix domain-containing protein [Planobacterium oryzisoli]|uniref:PepSY domain-containing protein n=1 Tax=Planobacterium oryzisoli TaxID=2771435 RepID=A0A930YVA3_9FLAO|nr:PepSY-associated TM helix domain-containing protein [Planobacterium oryzisoli]MBF5027027.1 PepSY domain-containing protein [Planobacterium oryzisoli]
MKHHHVKAKSKKKSLFKKAVGKIHLYVGLTIGAIVFLVSITGALYAFKAEVENLMLSEYYEHHEPNIEQKTILPIKEMERRVHAQSGQKYLPHWVEIPLDKTKTYRFNYYERDVNAWHYFDEFPVFMTYYVNPYTGQIVGSYDQKNSFFNIVKYIHWGFLLNSDWGKYIVGIPTILFLVMVLSGIILWWPKNRKASKQRFWFQWKNIRSWRRRNYDLHTIVGFYASFLAVIVTITGLFYSFLFVQGLVYFVFSGGKTTFTDLEAIHNKAPLSAKTDGVYDKAIAITEQLHPNAYGYTFDLGYEHMDEHEHHNLYVFVKQLPYSYHKNHAVIIDENSGELLKTYNHDEKNFGEKVVAANYDIHVGAILGIWGKILAFISSLACASLPVTGFLVWYGRNYGKKANKTVPLVSSV